MRHGDVVRVIWDDAHQSFGWHDKHESEGRTDLSTVVSVGLFIEKTKDALVLTSGISDYGQLLNILRIPLAGIKKTKTLERRVVNGH